MERDVKLGLEYFNIIYLNDVIGTLKNSSRNFNVEIINNNFVDTYFGNVYTTTLNITNNRYTTFNKTDWENELKIILNDIGANYHIVFYIVFDDGEEIRLNF